MANNFNTAGKQRRGVPQVPTVGTADLDHFDAMTKGKGQKGRKGELNDDNWKVEVMTNLDRN